MRTSSRIQRRSRFRVTALPTLEETEKPIFFVRPRRYTKTMCREGKLFPLRYTY